MTIFVIIFFPFLLSLGTWQIVRGFDKQDILDQYDFNKSLVPIESYELSMDCLLYTSPSPRDRSLSRMPSSA